LPGGATTDGYPPPTIIKKNDRGPLVTSLPSGFARRGDN